MNRQVARIQTMAITVAEEIFRTSPDKERTNCRHNQIQPPFQNLALGWKQPLPDNDLLNGMTPTIKMHSVVFTDYISWP